MRHNVVIGAGPDEMAAFEALTGGVFFSDHGREITSGDAEKVLDGAPSVRMRAPSPMSGEFYFHRNYQTDALAGPERGMLTVVHNLADVDALVRGIVCGDNIVNRVQPTTLVGSSNTTSLISAINTNNAHETPWTTRAAPTVGTTPWYFEVGFAANASPLSSVQNSQIVYVGIQWSGEPLTTPGGQQTVAVLIEVKEGTDVRASKNLMLRADADEDAFVIALLVHPGSFDDPTLSGMSVKVSFDAGPVNTKVWELGAINWMQVLAGADYDTGWDPTEQGAFDLTRVTVDPQASNVIPYLVDSAAPPPEGQVVENYDSRHTWVFFHWDDSIDIDVRGKRRIFKYPSDGIQHAGNLQTNWRPEIGVVDERAAWGHRGLMQGQRSSFKDLSTVLISKGGNRWTVRKKSARTLDNVSITSVESQEFVENVYTFLRQAGLGSAVPIAIRPDTPEVSAAISLYGTVTSLQPTGAGKGTLPDHADEGLLDLMGITLGFEELV